MIPISQTTLRSRHKPPHRAGFTLFELILSIALSAALLALIGMAIDLYLKRVALSRDRVEEAQLARSILSMIADDLRATAIYQPQDVSDVAQLMAQSASFDVDSIDEARSGSTGGAGGVGGSGTVGGAASTGGAGGSAGSGNSSAPSGDASTSADYETSMPLGISGGISELYIDVARLPGGDELFRTMTGYTNAPMAVSNNNTLAASGTSWGSTPLPSDLKTVRYFIRDGDRTDSSGLASTTLESHTESFAGGLVRQQIPRRARLFAEQTAAAAVLESGQVLIAPEVVHIEFHYFDGTQIVDMWNMIEKQSLPLAIEVRIWLTSPAEAATSAAAYDVQSLLSTAREYRQTVFLPMAELSRSGAAAGMNGSSVGSSGPSSSGTSTSSSSSGSSSTFGTSTNQP